MRWLHYIIMDVPFGDGQFVLWSFEQLLLFYFALIEFAIILLSVDIFPIIGQYFEPMLIELRLHKQRLVINLRPDRIIQFAVVPAQLYLIEYLLDKFILAVVVLAPDQVQIRRLLDDQLVVLESEG